MSSSSLPDRPNLEFLRQQARDLRREVRAGNPREMERVKAVTDLDQETLDGFSILDAQRTVAREYGFASWASLKREVNRRNLSIDEKVEQLVIDICQGRTESALQTLEENGSLSLSTFYSAVVTGESQYVRDMLVRNPSLALQPGGPMKNWYPLHYVAASKLHEEASEFAEGLRETTGVLLEKGADPNAFYTNPAWPDAPLRPLYHACGIANNAEIAAILIQAGAELNDGESVYHAAENYHVECLEVLREAGADLGQNVHPLWKNTPLYFLLGYRKYLHNAAKVEQGIRWLLKQGVDVGLPCEDNDECALHAAIRTNQSAFVIQLLLDAGADPLQAGKDGLTPYDLAIRLGHEEALALFVQHGTPIRALSRKEEFLRACMVGNRETAEEIRAAMPTVMEDLEEPEKQLLVEAAIENRVEAVRLMLDLGFDIGFKKSGEWGATALHWAAWYGQTQMVRLLLERGAPLDLPANPPEDSTPFIWAAHGFGHCKNPQGDYAAIVRAMIEAGAKPDAKLAEMASEEVAELIMRHIGED